ncbi:EamA family transporter [Zooshikella marina]|uniref:EamA family transporter n=1 Tax=Zooshikella ganghwensis TaxID=202772 RepID=UPI001BB077D6|nr:EamA family transporter [Zooshikella ganghwensis]MBU2705032.1 EamA family transporter [Zooshikella ganghwensis]
MYYLSAITLLWAFSFSLIGVYLAGQVDAYFSVLLRIALAFLLFIPLLRRQWLRLDYILPLMLIGAIQLGFMYIFYYQSFLLLTVPEVLLFTTLTPVYVALLYDVWTLTFRVRYLLAALLAVLGAVVIRYDNITQDYISGFLLVQGANVCFALGQVSYKILIQRRGDQLPQHAIFGFFYAGALVVALVAWGIWGTDRYPATSMQWGVLLWLGLGASGLGFFCWNKGATQVDVGTLAVMNNVLIPAGLVVNLLIWNRDADMVRLLLGGSIILFSLLLNYYWERKIRTLSCSLSH